MQLSSKIRIAKLVARTTVASVTTKYTKRALTNLTDAEPDSITVKLASILAGELVAEQLEPQTDALVEVSAARIVEWNENRKKNTKEEGVESIDIT